MSQSGSMEIYRILIMGKTGKGKSKLGNTLLGRNAFVSKGGMKSATKVCQLESGKVCGVDVEVTDTPGLTDTHESQEFIHRELTKSLTSLAPNPHAILMVCSARDRFTEEEFKVYNQAKELLGNDLVAHMVVVFTGMDRLKADDVSLEDEIKDGNCELRSMLKDADNRYCGVDNLTTNEEEMKNQVSNLIEKIKQAAAKNNQATAPVMKEVATDVKKVVDAKVKEGKSRQEAEKELKKEVMSETTPSYFPPMQRKVESGIKDKKMECTIL